MQEEIERQVKINKKIGRKLKKVKDQALNQYV